MPRKPRVYSDYFPFHIYARTNNRDEFCLDLTNCWELFEDQLWFLSNAYETLIHGFLLMPNHYHMLASTPLNNRSNSMCWFQSSTSREINLRSNRENHLWGGTYHAQPVWDAWHYAMVYKYILRNPVKAGLSKNTEDYQFSTLNQQLGLSPYKIPLTGHPEAFNYFLPESIDKELNWLNTPFNNELESAIERTLCRKKFKLPQAILDKKVICNDEIYF